jgi:hypothetical protein
MQGEWWSSTLFWRASRLAIYATLHHASSEDDTDGLWGRDPYQRIMPTTLTANDLDARGSLSSSQGNARGSHASSQSLPGQRHTRERVKDRVAAWETDVKRFGQDATKKPEVFRVSQSDDVDDEGDSADWRQTLRDAPSRSNARKNHDEASSKALSSAGSVASQSLDGREKDRGIAIAELKVEEAKLRLLRVDARVGLSRRSRNSSQALSVRFDEQSAISSTRRSRRRHTPEKEQSLGGTLGEVLEMDEEQAVAPPDDSHATMPYYSPRELRSHGSTSAGDASSAALDEPRAVLSHARDCKKLARRQWLRRRLCTHQWCLFKSSRRQLRNQGLCVCRSCKRQLRACQNRNRLPCTHRLCKRQMRQRLNRNHLLYIHQLRRRQLRAYQKHNHLPCTHQLRRRKMHIRQFRNPSCTHPSSGRQICTHQIHCRQLCRHRSCRNQLRACQMCKRVDGRQWNQRQS